MGMILALGAAVEPGEAQPTGLPDLALQDDAVELAAPELPVPLLPRMLGATMTTGGEFLIPVRVHYETDVPAERLQRFFELFAPRANQILSDSQIPARFVFEGPYPFPHTSTGDDTHADLLAYIEGYPEDGRVGVLIVRGGDTAGRGVLNTGAPEAGFILRSVVSIRGWLLNDVPEHDWIFALNAATTIAHEIGHNLGLHHEDECPSNAACPDGCGYTTPSDQNTVMTGGLITIPGGFTSRFADPFAMLNNEPLGVVGEANTVRCLREERLPGFAPFLASVAESCDAGADAFHLQGGRFRIDVCWRTRQGTTGTGRAVAGGTEESANVWFFNPSNWELTLKIIDACADPFNRWWVFAAGLTNVEVDIKVTDETTGFSRTYRNPQGTAFEALQDTDAFLTCP